jgi:sugar (pentulose or hexulose) kinase
MKIVAVLDIGKTNVKLALVDLDTRTEIAVETAPNTVRPGQPWPHFDTETQWRFLVDALCRLAVIHRIDGISITTHGACVALLDRTGALAAPVMDYEHTGPDGLAAAYDALRPPFAETGSPRLPMGLNLGAQLHYMLETDPGLLARTAHVVTWPQYWGFRLTGRLACDLTSLGCHTDLWNPAEGTWSSLPARLGLYQRMAPVRLPGDPLGTLLPDLQAATGLGPIPVLTGIHDSNASLVPHLLTRDPPFSVVSTGTWVISMAIGGTSPALDPDRDTLINVNAFGEPVPSARFMGGREYDLMRPKTPVTPTAADAAGVVATGIMLLPSAVPGTGPFPHHAQRWTVEPNGDAQLMVALSYSLALTTATCLDLIGARGPTLVEGPFTANPWYLSMLASATGRAVVASQMRTGTALGAALLFLGGGFAASRSVAAEIGPDPVLAGYAQAWRTAIAAIPGGN